MMDGNQLGFDGLLQDADTDNAARAFERDTGRLPGTWSEALTYHRQQIADHHAAMLANDFEVALVIRNEAHLLAKKLNNGEPGILASEDAPGCRLDVEARAPEGDIPLWGQSSAFTIDAAGLSARAEMGGMFGIGATAMLYLGFSVRAADDSKPFLSGTGYRSFLGCSVPREMGMTVDGFVRRVVETYIQEELRGRLVEIDRRWFK